MAKKHFEEYQNLNKALIEHFMSIIPTKYQLGYTQILTREPNRIFETTFNYFYNKCGQEDEVGLSRTKKTQRNHGNQETVSKSLGNKLRAAAPAQQLPTNPSTKKMH